MTQVLPEVNFNFREDTLLKNTTDPTTSEVIILGEDVLGEQQNEKSYEELLQEGLESELRAFDSWLSWKVKNELIAQIYNGIGVEDRQINLRSISDVVYGEILSEKDKHLQNAAHIENEIIPLAHTRRTPRFDDANYYWAKDIPNLEARSEIHYAVSSRIGEIEAEGDDGLYDLTENYIQRMILIAQDEVLAIVTQQKQELEQHNQENIAKINELQGAIGILKTQLEQTHEQLDDRDMALLDQELTLYATTRLAA